MRPSATFKRREAPRQWLMIRSPNVCSFLQRRCNRVYSQRAESPDETKTGDIHGSGCRTAMKTGFRSKISCHTHGSTEPPRSCQGQVEDPVLSQVETSALEIWVWLFGDGVQGK